MDAELMKARIERAMERYERERIKPKHLNYRSRIRRNGVKLPLKKEHLIEVRNEYDSMY